ncbi:dTDP-4-dehydrorhamnose reductase [Salinimicrobium oceani]|uniref:dTDP-4-dehydrorhamnose reductase n=1 Tax=Salinimicrobium oceani TaxID=2722702 RepID=A0ABX1CUN3_9FLAO|nr:dTDP-4-dehydrorhamnose reductase [Salinimicrobium oceani]NJW51994.1 dTDP-4-dehydrorhamnose reductase [Salinimicrobium oceani]
MKVLVTGAGGQLGRCFKKAALDYPELDFTFTTSEEFDLTQFGVVGAYFRREQFDVCINCAAYTNVEQAEKEQEMAYLVNAESVRNLSAECAENDCLLIHFSTDYVFDGQKETPYSEEDETGPLNVYGASKLLGEQYILNNTSQYLIFRVSWLYSDLGKNFFNTIRNKAEAGEVLNITTAQHGTPTNAYDLAYFVLEILAKDKVTFGLYHYSNQGEATWYDFAHEILSLIESPTELKENNDYKTLATRPAYSVLNKEKVSKTFEIPISDWKVSLKKLI